ncbi:MAG: hypothetical protein WA996_07165 [Candidatus Promineifilaceae bacterium]
MDAGTEKRRSKSAKDSKKMPAESAFYDRIVPIVLIALAVLTVVIVLAAAGILLGIVPV